MADDDKTRIGSDEGVRKGTQLNGIYEIDERIASGGMGEVYRGHNIQTDDPVAIKIVLPEFARDQNILALFRKEASVLNHLAHDAIVRYHVFSMDPMIGRPYLAMEFVDGQSLADRLQSGPLPPQDARKMVARVASGLALAHGAGIVHRDLSPDNIILQGGKVERSKIIDFGIAKSATVGGGTLLGGKFAGKYNFVSPEQLGLFGGEVTERSDIYSLGLVLAAALRGEALDMSGSQVEVIEKRRVLPDLTGIDPGLRPLVEAMLQPDPRYRIGSASQIVDWLRDTEGRSVPPGYTPPGYQPTQIAPGFPGQPPHAGSYPPYTTPPPGVSQHPYGGAPYGGSQPPPGSYPHYPGQPVSQHPFRPGGAPYTGSMPPSSPYGGSVNPYGTPGQPPMLGQPMPGSLPPQQPGPRPMLPGGAAAQAAQPAKRSNTLLYALAGVVVLALAGGGAWYAGLFGSHPAASVAESKPPTLTPANGQQGGQQGGQASSTTAPGGSTAASALPPKTDNPTEWLKAYHGGACFFAAVQPEAGSPVGMDVYATAEAAADKLAKDYEQVNGVAPQVRLRKLDRRQCAVADFLAGAGAKGGNDPSLVLSKDDLKVGDVLSGTVGNAGARQVHLYLVTNEGVVYGLDELWKQRKTTGDSSVFGMKLFPTTDEPMPEPQPHLIVTVASSGTLDAAGITDPVLASELFPKIGTEFSAAGDAGAAVGYFMFGG